jgi:hypothetical protein
MPDIAAVLERAAAEPTRAPDLEGGRRRARRRRLVTRVGAVGVFIVIVAGVVAVSAGEPRRVRVQNGPASTAAPQPTTATSHDATIAVVPGWTTSPQPLAWWLDSPFELFSIATASIPPSPHTAPNEAACPSEIPQVAVDNLPADGAYLWIGEWRPGVGLFQSSPRPAQFSFETAPAAPACLLPRGERAFNAIYHDAPSGRDFVVTYVLGSSAPTSRLADINRMLDSLHFAEAPPTP